MDLSTEQIAAIADAYFMRGMSSACPSCGNAKLTVTPGLADPLLAVNLTIRCARCQATGKLLAKKPATNWTPEQMKQIVEGYWSERSATCPNDGTRIEFRPAMGNGQGEPPLAADCRRCGRALWSPGGGAPMEVRPKAA